jgi:diguanylate cyclase (GGDEF)-like protein
VSLRTPGLPRSARPLKPAGGGPDTWTVIARAADRRDLLVRILVRMLAVAVAGVVIGEAAGVELLVETVVPLVGAGVLLLAVVLCVLRAICDRSDRLAWIAFAAAIAAWTLGEQIRTAFYADAEPSFPDVWDAGYLLFFLLAGGGAVTLVRSRLRTFSGSVVLDGAIAVAAVASVVAALVIPIAEAAPDPQAAVGNLVYPVGDVALVSLVLTGFAAHGWRPTPEIKVLGAALVVYAVADVLWAVAASQGATESLWVGIVWVGAMTLVAVASTLEGRETPPVRAGLDLFVVPVLSALAAIAVLVAGNVGDVPLGSVALAVLALVLVMVRTGVTFHENARLALSRRQAVTDDLTGLANRRRLTERMEAAFADPLDAESAVGLLLVDLDRFKELNDTLGHHVGDRMLAMLGPRLQAAVPEADLVARLGGDEFAVLLTGGADRVALAGAAGRIAAAIDEPFALDGLELRTRGSIGGALAPEHAEDAVTLLQRADVAMYEAKRAGLVYAPYEPDRDGHSRDRLALSEELRRGIDAGELEVHYQPKADLRTGEVAGVEALVRWRHPRRGLLFPDEFVGLAEEAGLMRGLTRAVLGQAIGQVADWRARGLDLSVAVNLAMPDLLDPLLPGDVAAMLDRAGLPANALVLEITEHIVMADPERVLAVLAGLRDHGIALSLDDFGTGYSSLSYLKRLPVQELKVDRSFVMRMLDEPEDEAIVRAIADLGRSLGLRVVAEGIEDRAVWDALAAHGCTHGQGYHLSRPLPAADLEPLLFAPVPAWTA